MPRVLLLIDAVVVGGVYVACNDAGPFFLIFPTILF